MLRRATKLIAWVVPWSALALGAAAPLFMNAVPAQAQDMLGFFRPFAPPTAAPVGALQLSSEGSPLTVRVRPRRKEARRKEARAEPQTVKAPPVQMPLKAKDPGDIANPVPQLLADGTLRSGDMVMFPGGLRVFTGARGANHALADFEPISRAGKAVPTSTRKLVAQLRPGSNAAWSADVVRISGKLVAHTKRADAGSNVRRKGN